MPRESLMVQLKSMVDYGYRVSVDRFGGEYEVTVGGPGGAHEHHDGATIAEAMNKAWKATMQPGTPTPTGGTE